MKSNKKYTDSYPHSIFGKIPDDVIKGIKSKKKVFTYPIQVQLDLTNNCNFNCVGCWCHSDLMGELKFSKEIKNQMLTKEKVMELIDDLAQGGTKEIQLSGSGEPTMYPFFMDVIKKIKSKGMILHLITNFSLITQDMINKFIEYKLDRITISLWAGTPETYIKTHPNQTKKTYEKIKKNLLYLNNKKQDNPITKIYNVISKLNFLEIKEMIDFAYETRADLIEFQTIDSVKGKSESLLLNNDDKSFIIKKLKELELSLDYMTYHFDPVNKYTDFVRFYKDSLPKGFSLEKTKNKIKCKKGFISNTFNFANEVNFRYDFIMPPILCSSCGEKLNCYPEKPFQHKPFNIKFLRILGYGEFYRKLKNEKSSSGVYETKAVDTIPCTIGWSFTRILPDGKVIPCCKAHKKPLGNINEKNFSEIWCSEKYSEFRYNALTLKKSHLYFKEINCYKSCDNVGMNKEIDVKLKKGQKND